MAQKITTISDEGIALIQHFEGLKTKAYMDSAGVWTIGIGTIMYPDGSKVKSTDRIDEARAVQIFKADLRTREAAVDAMTRDDISQAQFDALVSFTYNLGTGALRGSTLLQTINMRSTDSAQITKLFCQWCNVRQDGKLKYSAGLERRRKAEAYLFNTGNLNFFE